MPVYLRRLGALFAVSFRPLLVFLPALQQLQRRHVIGQGVAEDVGRRVSQ